MPLNRIYHTIQALPELDGKTAKMYRGGKICLSDHFKPLWARYRINRLFLYVKLKLIL